MTQKIALVTGGGTGIGKAAALALAGAGFDLVVAGRRREPIDKVAAEIRALGRDALAVVANVTDPASVTALFDAAREKFGRLDLTFNNAGISAGGPIEDTAFETWKKVVDTNLTGVFLCMQAAFRIMKDQSPRGGRIINNGSISAHAPRPGSWGYTATKHGVTGLTKTGSLDGRKHDIAVGQIDIGNADSDLAERMKQGVPQPNGSIMPEPVMELKHVADAIVYMAGLPLDANVQFMTVMATKMPFVGRG
jgi:NAD(P)-dependent dehydrogenase (short-subunit alcohol dehydrogenase family)